MEPVENLDFKCDYCSYSNKRNGRLKDHLLKYHFEATKLQPDIQIHQLRKTLRRQLKPPKQYKCSHCNYASTTNRRLLDHTVKIHPHITKIRYLQCDLCFFKTRSENILRKHKSRHDKNDTYRCVECEFETNSKFELCRHNLNRHRLIKCPHCDYETKDLSVYKQHQIGQHATIFFHCDQCFYSTKRKKRLEDHMIRKHSVSDKLFWYKCNHCGFRTRKKQELIDHIAPCKTKSYQVGKFEEAVVKIEFTEEESIQIKEEWCSFSEKEENPNPDIEYLKTEKHDISLEITEQSRKYECADCSFKTNNKRDFGRHQIDRHTDLDKIDWHKCEFCLFKSKQKVSLISHCKTKHKLVYESETKQSDNLPKEKINWEKCGYCPFKTKQKINLVRHCISKHTSSYQIEIKKLNEENTDCKNDNIETVKSFKYECSECNYRTNHKGDYTKHHSRQHTDFEEWLRCDLCSFKSKQKGNLTKHYEAKHTPAEDINWLQCPHCSYKAKTKDLYSKHQSQLHNDFVKLYECDHCSYTTKRKYALGRHTIIKHSNEKPIKCELCGYATTTTEYLKRHVQWNHEKSETEMKCDECAFVGRNVFVLQRHVKNVHMKKAK